MPGVTEPTDWAIFVLVAAARLLWPLTIPRYPLLGILVALILDGVDQTIFQQFTTMSLDWYQGYDKALDIYYLAIAYISTLRNWSNHFAFQISRFLFYWRLAGVALFELTQIRLLLMIFPNTFEYFFIFYEAYKLRWDPERMSKKFLIGAAVAIWIVIKLPQEYWIHIAQFDTTDLIKSQAFGVAVDTPWGEIVQAWPGILVGAALLLVLIVAGAWWALRRWLPPADRAPALSADAHQPAFSAEQVSEAVAAEAREIVDWALVEKIALIGLVSFCFAQILPGVQATPFQLILGTTVVVLVNTALSHWLARRGFGWAFTLGQFVVLAGANLVLLLVYALLRSRFDHAVSLANIAFFVLLLTLLVTLYDRYRQVYLMRFT